jgi:hypothetical protein
MQLLKKQLPIAVAFIMGVVMFFQFYVPTRFSNTLLTSILQWDRVIAGFAMLLGIYSLLNHHYHRLRRQTPGWGFSVVVYVGFFAMLLAGFIWGIVNDPPKTVLHPIRGIVAGPEALRQYESLVSLKPGEEAPTVEPPVKSMYDVIQGLEAGAPVLFVLDYDQTNEAELYPVTLAFLKHIFSMNARVIALTLTEGGAPLLDRVLNEATAGTLAQYGVTYVNLGYLQGGPQVIASAGQNLAAAFATDYQGNPTADMLVLKGFPEEAQPVPEPWATLEVASLDGLASLKDLKQIVDVADGIAIDPWVSAWIDQGLVDTYKVTVGVGTLANLASLYATHYRDPYQVQVYMPFMWMYDFMFVPMQATMFSILAFYIASAAYRAFRARTKEATVLLVTAIIVMLGRVPLGSYLLWIYRGGHWVQLMGLDGKSAFLSWFTEWILNNPSMAAQRGIMIGIGLGVIATSLRIIFGIERTYMGGGD